MTRAKKIISKMIITATIFFLMAYLSVKFQLAQVIKRAEAAIERMQESMNH